MQNIHDIIVTYGTDPFTMTENLAEKADLASLIGDRSRPVILKPNLVVGVSPEGGATTHPQIAEALIRYLQKNGFSDITILEGSWVGDRTENGFRACHYYEMADRYHVGLVDGKKDEHVAVQSHGLTMEVCRRVMENNSFLISLPVLKGHCQTLMTCALKNMKGVLSDRSKRMFHAKGLMKPIAALNAARHADFIVVDSLNGDMDFEEGGNPVETDRMFTARDSVLCDAYGASLMGFSLGNIPYIGIAEEWGVGTSDLSHAHIIELNRPAAPAAYHPTGAAADLASWTAPKSACSACFGNLIHALKRLDENGDIEQLPARICIGQDYRKISNPDLIGVGTCTAHLGKSLPGCPPDARAMLEYLESMIR